MRLPDVWLMYCEAMNELHGPSDELYNLIDKIRGRGKLPALDRNKFKTKDTFLMRSNRKELSNLWQRGNGSLTLGGGALQKQFGITPMAGNYAAL